MLKFLVRRLVFMIATLFVVSMAVFAISELAPGNIAINSLGNTITPEQEQSFNAQNGLDQSGVTRYIRWIIGSDWQAERLVGHPVKRLYDEANQRYSWWAVAADGTLYQNATEDGEVMEELRRGADGKLTRVKLGPEVWQADPSGVLRLQNSLWGFPP